MMTVQIRWDREIGLTRHCALESGEADELELVENE